MLSRRSLLTTAGRLLPLAGAARLWTAAGVPAVLSASTGLASGAEAVPRARYWLPVPKPGARLTPTDCATCHRPDRIAGRSRYAHQADAVKCQLCAQDCIDPARRARPVPRARQRRGELRRLVYGRPLATHVDPIEKKPFYHFLPGAAAYSLGTAGCPLACRFCQNWELSQSSPEDHDAAFVAPAEVVRAPPRASRAGDRLHLQRADRLHRVPARHRARGAARGLRSVMVSCGFMNEAPLADMCAALDAIKIDLKGFSEEFYRDVCGAALAPVLRTSKQIAAPARTSRSSTSSCRRSTTPSACWASWPRWIAGELGPDVPLHFTRFHPDYQLLNLPPTPVATLERARAIALERGPALRLRRQRALGTPATTRTARAAARSSSSDRAFFVAEMHLEGWALRVLRRASSPASGRNVTRRGVRLARRAPALALLARRRSPRLSASDAGDGGQVAAAATCARRRSPGTFYPADRP